MESYAAGETRAAAARGDHRRELRAHRRGARRPRGAGRGRDAAGAGPGPSWTATSTTWRVGLVRGRASARATGSASGRRTARSGRSPSTPPPRSARSWSTSTRRTAPTSSPTRSTSRAASCWSRRRRSRPATTARWSRRSRDQTPARAGALPRHRRTGPTTASATRASRLAGRWSSAGRSPPDDPINIQYTSGTTGYPKGATLSHRNILNNGYFTTELIGFTAEDRLCIPVPFYHCFGMVMGNLGCTSHGATMVIPAPGFDPEITLQTIADERCTAVYGVPTMFIAMQNHPTFADHDLSSLRTGIMAGSICPVEVMKRCVERHAHGRGVDRLRHDRDVAGLLPDPGRTTTSSGVPPRSAGCTRTSRSRSSTRSPARPSSAASPVSSAPAATR